jgi:hypothetical protein
MQYVVYYLQETNCATPRGYGARRKKTELFTYIDSWYNYLREDVALPIIIALYPGISGRERTKRANESIK